MSGTAFEVFLIAGHIVGAGGESGEIRIAPLQLHNEGMFILCPDPQKVLAGFSIIDRPGALDDEKIVYRGGGGFRAQRSPDGEQKIVSRNGGAVAPFCIGIKMKGETGIIIRGLPLSGNAGDDIPVRIYFAQTFKDRADYQIRGLPGGGLRVQRVYVLGQGIGEFHAGLISIAAGGKSGQQRETEKQG